MKLKGITSDKDLIKLMKELNLSLNNICFKDKLKEKKIKNGNYIINMASSTDNNGTHWTCFHIDGENCYYFDSIGLKPLQEIIDYCKDKKGLYNPHQIQKINSNYCGEWCCLYLSYMNESSNKKNNFEKFIKNFKDYNNFSD